MTEPNMAGNNSNPRPILIIGGGLAGLALAHGLSKHGFDNFHVFERDAEPNTRGQGYRIKVFPNAVPDLEYLLSEDRFRDFERTSAETVMGETTLNSINGLPTASRQLNGPKPYTVDRGVLRLVLLRGMEKKIHWGKTFQSYGIRESDNTVVAHFEDGSSFEGSLLVGADGNRSPVRKQFLPQHVTVDAQGLCVYGRTYFSPQLLQQLSPRLQRWFTIVRDVAPAIQEIIFDSSMPVTMFIEKIHFPHRADYPDILPQEDYLYWAMLIPSKLMGPTEEHVKEALAKSARQLGLRITSEWDPSIRCLVEHQDDAHAASLRVISAAPDLINWTPSPYVTLVGDAIHVMSPGAGAGAVTALKDAAVLTKCLTEKGISAESIGSYETEMRGYAAASIARSSRGGMKSFAQPSFDQCKPIEV